MITFYLQSDNKMKLFLILAIMLLTACSTNRVRIHPQVMNKQTITYVRGGPRLHSQTILQPELTILDYSYDEMLAGLTVTNTTPEPILFSEKNLKVELAKPEKLVPATVYSYEQIIEQAAEAGGSTAARVGDTAVGIGVGFIPFGGIAYTVGKLFYSLGSQDSETHQKRIDAVTFSQMNKNYLRQQTLQPGESYSGIVKIGFEDNLQEGDQIIFQVIGSDETEKFNFVCKSLPEK